MDILAALRSEEKNMKTKLGGIRQAIHALNGHWNGQIKHSEIEIEIGSDRGHKLKGRKLSLKHRRAIALGIAKSKARKAGAK